MEIAGAVVLDVAEPLERLDEAEPLSCGDDGTPRPGSDDASSDDPSSDEPSSDGIDGDALDIDGAVSEGTGGAAVDESCDAFSLASDCADGGDCSESFDDPRLKLPSVDFESLASVRLVELPDVSFSDFVLDGDAATDDF
jgi:hypothetical protein